MDVIVPISTTLVIHALVSGSSAPNTLSSLGLHIYATGADLVTATVTFEERDRAAARRALGCHRSQATE